jgi:hypothetical protein
MRDAEVRIEILIGLRYYTIGDLERVSKTAG